CTRGFNCPGAMRPCHASMCWPSSTAAGLPPSRSKRWPGMCRRWSASAGRYASSRSRSGFEVGVLEVEPGLVLIGASQQTEILFAAQFAQESDAGGRAVTGAEAVGRNAGGVAGEIGNRQLAAAGGGDQHVVVAHERVHLLHQLETDAV